MIGRKSVLMMGNTVVGGFLGLLALTLIYRFYGSAAFGQVEYALGILGLGYFITDLGLAAAHTKRVSEGRDPGDCFATFAVFKVVSTAVFVLGALGVFFVYAVVLGKQVESTTPTILLLVLAFYVAKSWQDVGQATFEARMETARSQLTTFVDTLVRVGLTVVGALLLAALAQGRGPLVGRLDSDHPFLAWMAQNAGAVYALATLAGALAAASVATWYVLRTLELGRFRWELLRDYWRFALPLFVVTSTIIISTNVDRAALGFFAGDVDAGDFGGIRRFTNVLVGLGAAVGTLLFPVFSGLAARGEHDTIRAHMTRSVRYLSMIMMGPVLFLVFFAGDFIRIVLGDVGIVARGGGVVLALLAAYSFLQILSVPHGMLLFGLDRPGINARAGIVAAVSNVVLNLLLIPDDIRSLGIPLAGLGGRGAALATLISGLLYYGMLHYGTRKVGGVRVRARMHLHLLAALAMVAALFALDAHTPFALERWYHLLAYTLIGGAVYLAALVGVREFRGEDWRYVLDVAHPGEMLAYVRDELFGGKKR